MTRRALVPAQPPHSARDPLISRKAHGMSDIQPQAHRRARGRGLGRLAALLTALAVMLSLSGAAAFGAADVHGTALHPVVHVPAKAIDAVAQMQPGWNLGNTFDAIGADETAWGNPVVTQATARQHQGAGLQAASASRSPGASTRPPPRRTPIDADLPGPGKQVVDWALADGLYVVINIHHDSWQWVIEHADRPRQRAGPLQRHLDRRSRAPSSPSRAHLLFESVNEPQFTGVTGDAQEYPAAERAEPPSTRSSAAPAAPTRPAARAADPAHQSATRPSWTRCPPPSRPERPELVATIHYYGYWPFSMNIAGGTTVRRHHAEGPHRRLRPRRRHLRGQGHPGHRRRVRPARLRHGTPAPIEQGEKLKYFE